MTGTEIVFNINEITFLKTKDDVVEKNDFWKMVVILNYASFVMASQKDTPWQVIME